MKEILIPTITATIAGFLTWLFNKLKTKRERKDNYIELINKALNPLLDSIKQLTEQNNELVVKLVKEQDEKTELLTERYELKETILKLEKKIQVLEKQVNKIMKNEKDS